MVLPRIKERGFFSVDSRSVARKGGSVLTRLSAMVRLSMILMMDFRGGE